MVVVIKTFHKIVLALVVLCDGVFFGGCEKTDISDKLQQMWRLWKDREHCNVPTRRSGSLLNSFLRL